MKASAGARTTASAHWPTPSSERTRRRSLPAAESALATTPDVREGGSPSARRRCSDPGHVLVELAALGEGYERSIARRASSGPVKSTMSAPASTARTANLAARFAEDVERVGDRDAVEALGPKQPVRGGLPAMPARAEPPVDRVPHHHARDACGDIAAAAGELARPRRRLWPGPSSVEWRVDPSPGKCSHTRRHRLPRGRARRRSRARDPRTRERRADRRTSREPGRGRPRRRDAGAPGPPRHRRRRLPARSRRGAARAAREPQERAHCAAPPRGRRAPTRSGRLPRPALDDGPSHSRRAAAPRR